MPFSMVKIGDLVKPSKISLTADEHGRDILGLVVGYNEFLAHPFEVKWFKDKHITIWEDPQDIKIISSAKFWRKNENRR